MGPSPFVHVLRRRRNNSQKGGEANLTRPSNVDSIKGIIASCVAAVPFETYVTKQQGPGLEYTWEATCFSFRINGRRHGQVPNTNYYSTTSTTRNLVNDDNDT